MVSKQQIEKYHTEKIPNEYQTTTIPHRWKTANKARAAYGAIGD
jgi:hypothetical protein